MRGELDLAAAGEDKPAESFARLKRAIDAEVAAIKRDLALWLDQRRPKDANAARFALLETAFDRYIEERTATTADLPAAAADALDMVQPVLRRAVQRRRVSLQISASKADAAAIPVSDVECAQRLTETLNLLEAVAGPLPKDAALRQFIDDAAEPLATLLGYFAGGTRK
jgi:hypothetical protein